MEEQIKRILAMLEEQRDCDGDICPDDLPEDFEIIEEGDWTQDHKYQSCEDIVRHKGSNTFWCIARSRSGSYHTDWYYGEAYVSQVEKREEVITVTKWVGVK